MPEAPTTIEPASAPPQVDAQNVEQVESQEGSLSNSDALFNLPTQRSIDEGAKTAQEQQPPAQPEAPKTPEILTEPPKSPDLTFETQKPKSDEPFKSEDAAKILQEAPPKGVHAKNWKEATTKWAGIVEAKDTQLHRTQKEHQQVLSTLQKENELLAKRVSDLSGYESVIDFQTSEKFQKEYEGPVKDAEKDLMDFAKTFADPAGLAELEKGIGDRRYLIAALSQLEKNAPEVATEFRLGVQKLLDVRRQRDGALQSSKQNYEKLVTERKAESAKKSVEFDSTVKSTVETYVKQMGGDGRPQFPFLVKLRLPEGADATTQANVDKWNKGVEENVAALDQIVRNDDPKERVRMAVGYMTAVAQGTIIANLQKQLAEKNDLIARVQKAGTPPDKASGPVSAAAEPKFEGSLSDLASERFRPR